MDDNEVRLLLGLLGEDCCCECEEQARREREKQAGRHLFLPGAAVSYQVAQPAGSDPVTGQPSMPVRRRGRPPDEPFIPLLPPAYDSPQRPGAWGAGFIPGIRPEPQGPPRALTHEAIGQADTLAEPADFFPPAYQLADGAGLALSAGPVRVRAGRGALTVKRLRRTLYPAAFAYALDPYGQGAYHPRGDIQPTPEALSPFGALPGITVPEPGASVTLTFPAIRYRTTRDEVGRVLLSEWHPLEPRRLDLRTGQRWEAFDAIGARWQEQLLAGGWPTLPQSGPEVVIERRGPITRGNLREQEGTSTPMGDVRDLQVYREDRPVREGGPRYWTIGRQREVLESGELPSVPVPETDLWQAGVVLQIRDADDPYPWGLYDCTWLNSMPREVRPEPPLPWTDRTWQTPGREIVWTPEGGGTLTAYGHTLTGGTWGGVSPPGSWHEGRAVVLHEMEGTVTALWPDGKRESCARAEFEARVLGCEKDAFQHFSPIGLGANVWPPQWTWAVTGDDEARAVTAWDAWRDLTKREWPGRPRRRPERAAPPARLRPPLGVTLATTGRVPRYEEPLKIIEGQQQPPWHLPAKVEVQRGGEWMAEPKALAALAKPALYPPALQNEALDDRTSVRGLLRVTWAGEPLPDGGTRHEARAALLLRVKTGAKLPTLTVNGIAVPLRPLGRSAGGRGWQPYLATWDAPYGVVRATPLTLSCSAPLSRLLLTRIGLGKQAGGIEI